MAAVAGAPVGGFMDALIADGSGELAGSLPGGSAGRVDGAAAGCLQAQAQLQHRRSLECARAAQDAALLGGLDVPMLDELLPLSELHDPFLGAACWQPHAARGAAQLPSPGHAHPSAPGVVPVHAPGPGHLFCGVPAYAEPDAAALLNNSAGLGLGLGFGGGVAALQQLHAPPPESPLAVSGGGLPPAIAAAQQRAAARLHVERASSGGHSRVSGGSTAAQPAAPVGPAAGSAPPPGAHPSQCQPHSDLSSGAQLEDAAGSEATGAPPPPPPPPPRRGGRPREAKPYDSLIDPGLPLEEVRRLRRVLSNRESARRSRRRRQTQVVSLESELEALKTDNERLEGELSQTSSVAAQLAAERAALLQEVERLRARLAALAPGGGAPAALPPAIEQAQRMAHTLQA